ncbi:MAG: hypothetical protein ACYDBZ_04130 [Steroidobacteraceae bacterium]
MTQELRCDDLGAQQLLLIERSRAFLLAEKRRGVDVGIAPECYLNGWARVAGNACLRRLAGQRNGVFELAVARARDAMLIAAQSGYEVVSAAGQSKGFSRLIVSWCRGGDFMPDGSYTDRYFRLSSRSTVTTFWFLIAIDQAVPERLDSNIAIFRRKPGTSRIDYFHLLRSAFRSLGRKPRRADGRVPLLSAAVSFADQVAEAVVAKVELGSYESVVMPYEAQPFQHAVFRAAKSLNPTIRTVGYLHSALPPLPTDLIRRSGAPELLLVHGRGQVDILTRCLEWPQHALRSVASLRYRAADAGALDGYIFLPYFFDDQHLIEIAFRDFLIASPPRSLPRLTVRNHPVMQESQVHAQLQHRMEALLIAHQDRFAVTGIARRLSVFVGATAAILEALERGVEIVHICSRPLMEAHSTAVWRELSVERLGKHVFRYRLSLPGTYIDFGDENDSIDKYLDSNAKLDAGRNLG